MSLSESASAVPALVSGCLQISQLLISGHKHVYPVLLFSPGTQYLMHTAEGTDPSPVKIAPIPKACEHAI